MVNLIVYIGHRYLPLAISALVRRLRLGGCAGSAVVTAEIMPSFTLTMDREVSEDLEVLFFLGFLVLEVGSEASKGSCEPLSKDLTITPENETWNDILVSTNDAYID